MLPLVHDPTITLVNLHYALTGALFPMKSQLGSQEPVFIIEYQWNRPMP